MGHHYNPRKHLRRFEIPERPGFVWMYDKKTDRWAEVSVGSAAQERGFYDDQVEKALGNLVEKPGNIAIDKLRRSERLTDDERMDLSQYMSVMATRGPRFRAKAMTGIPVVMQRTIARIRADMTERGIDPASDKGQAFLRRCEEEGQKIVADPTPILPLIRKPFTSVQMNQSIYDMQWHVVQTNGPSYFVTGDTPAHLFECYGTGTEKAEFTFTISTDLAIICENVGRSATTVFQKPEQYIVREVNRRILSHCLRFVFCHKKETWVPTVLQKANPFLSVIRWES